MTIESSDSNDFEWSPYFEVHLIHSMGGLKPLGLNRNFLTAVIIERFISAIGMEVPAQVVLDKLETYYDLNENRLDEIPFLNDHIEFSLPAEDFPSLGRKDIDIRLLTDENSMGSKSEGGSSTSSDSVPSRKDKPLSKYYKKDLKKHPSPFLEKRTHEKKKQSSVKEENRKFPAKRRSGMEKKDQSRRGRH